MNRLARFAGWFVLLNGWRRYLAAFLAGLVSALSMAPLDLFPLLFVTLPVFVWLMDGVYADSETRILQQGWRAFAVGWWFGFGYFLAGLWWIGNAMLVEAAVFAWALPLAVLVLPALMATFWGGAAVLARLLWSDHWLRVIAVAVALAAFEYLRGVVFTGFPWNTIGYAAMPTTLAMQSAALVGLYGVTLLAIIVFAAPLTGLVAPSVKGGGGLALLIAAALILAGHLGYGGWRLNTHPTRFNENVVLRLMQPAIAQEKKFDPAETETIIATYLALSAADAGESGETNGLDEIDFLVWPESAFPFLLTDRPDVLAAIGELLPENTHLITGAMRAEADASPTAEDRVYNSIYLIDGNGEIAGAADKVHLVPFGEYLPFQDRLERLGLEQLTQLRGGFTEGVDRRLIDGGEAGPFLPLICYEIIFSGDIQPSQTARPETGANRARWIVNLTNDTWFGRTPGPHQHFRQSVVRGVEEGLPVVRVANSGISGISDAYGRVLQQLGLGERGSIDGRLPKPVASPTLFSSYGNSLFFLMLAGLFVITMIGRTLDRK